jgi:hypothetical protein
MKSFGRIASIGLWICLGTVGTVAAEATSDGEKQPVSATGEVADSGTAGSVEGQPEDDAPFVNALEPDADPLPRWSVRTEWTGSRSVDSGGAGSDTWLEIDRDWHLAGWTPGLRLGWTRTTSDSGPQTQWKVGAALDRDLPGSTTLEFATDYRAIVSGPGDASGSAGLSWNPSWGDHLAGDLSATGTWERLERGSLDAGVGISPDWTSTGGRLGGWFGRNLQTYENAKGNLRSAYANTWGWSAEWALRKGSWTTGPKWTGDWTKLNTTANEKIVSSTGSGKSKLLARKVPSNGIVVNQEFLWNIGWKPLPVVDFSLDLFRTWGDRTLQPRSGATPLQKATLNRWSENQSLPQDSKGLSLSMSLLW